MKRWTKAEVDRLRACYASMSGPQLEKQFGCSIGVIRRKAKNIGLAPKRTDWKEIARRHVPRILRARVVE